MKFTAFSIAAVLATVASALTPADSSKPPEGNPIGTPGLDQQVPVGAPFHITWQPTTSGSVSILLLRGPSTNVVPISTIADSIPNSGDFTWTPSTDLENDHTHYGIQIIVEGTGQYQYSPQFGIKNDKTSEGQDQLPHSTLTLISATSDAVVQVTESAIESQAPTPAPTLAAGNAAIVNGSYGTGTHFATGAVPAATPSEQPKYPIFPISQAVSSVPVIHAVPVAPTVQPVEPLAPAQTSAPVKPVAPAQPLVTAATIAPTLQAVPSASNLPAKPSAPLPFNMSSGAARGSSAFGGLAAAVLVAMVW